MDNIIKINSDKTWRDPGKKKYRNEFTHSEHSERKVYTHELSCAGWYDFTLGLCEIQDWQQLQMSISKGLLEIQVK